jgi:predicted nucleic acid-binding protein
VVRQVIVDASVVVAGLFKDGSVRDALLNADDVRFVAPAYLQAEVARHTAEVASRANIPRATVEAVLEDLLSVIDFVAPGAYASWVEPARRLARRSGAMGDEEYVALALALESPIWTLDRDFRRIPGIQVLGTRDVARF